MRELRLSIVHLLLPFLIIAVAGLLSMTSNISAQQLDTGLYSGLRWRMLGPFRAGRINAVSGVAGQPDTFYFGSVGGGLWKSSNSGRTWIPSSIQTTLHQSARSPSRHPTKSGLRRHRRSGHARLDCLR